MRCEEPWLLWMIEQQRVLVKHVENESLPSVRYCVGVFCMFALQQMCWVSVYSRMSYASEADGVAYLYVLFKAKPLTGRRPRDRQVK